MGSIDRMTASTSSSIARRAAIVNNEGAALLQCGRYHDAVRAFSSVLTTLKPFIPGNGGTNVNVNFNNNNNNNCRNHSLIGATTTNNPTDAVAGRTESIHHRAGTAASSTAASTESANISNNINGDRTRGCQEKRPVPTGSNDHHDGTAARAAKRKREHGINSSVQQQQQQQQQHQHQQLQSPSSSGDTANNTSYSLSHVEAAVAAVTVTSNTDKDRQVSVNRRRGHGNNNCEQDKEEEYFIFQDPIEIPLDVVPKRSAPSKKLITKFVVVVMYNLALAVHMSAEHSPVQEESHCCDHCDCDGDIDMSLSSYDDEERRRIMLVRAQKLYELAFQMHLEESCDVTLLYSLALMNNLGLIYRMTGDVDRSQRCFKNQLSTMMYLLEAQEARTIKQWDGLFSNVMNFVLKEQMDISAPAA